VAVQAFTGSSSSGSWPPMLLVISQITNQTKVMTAGYVRLRTPIA
jgi:hypothetical protein